MTQDQNRKVIYRVFGDVCYAPFNDEASYLTPSRAKEYFDRRVIPEATNVHVYDVYQDGTFHCFSPATDEPMKEPDSFVQDRKEIDEWINSHSMEYWTRDHFRASHVENETAFQTLCSLGFGPHNKGFNADDPLVVPSHDGTLRNTIRNFRVEYYGEDEPWLEENEYRKRNGLSPIEY